MSSPPPLAGAGSASPPTVDAQPGTPPPAADGRWISYGNGTKNWFNNTAETKISVATASQLHIAWMETPGEVTAPPVVVGDRLYVASSAGASARNTSDGKQIWVKPNIRTTSGPAYDDVTKMLFVVETAGRIHALAADTGDEKWVMPISSQPATNGWGSPVVSRNLVLSGIGSLDSGNFKGGVVAFDTMTGAQVWTHSHVKTAGASVWAGPAADETMGVVFAGCGNNYGATDDSSDSIFALSMDKGDLLWNMQATTGDGFITIQGGGGPDHDFGTNPILLDVKGRSLIAAGQKSGMFWVLDRTTGKLVWKQKLSSASNAQNGGILNSGAFDGKRFIVSANEGGAPGNVYALDADPEKAGDDHVLWKRKLDALVWAPITVANNVCFVPVGTNMWILNCETGEPLHEPIRTPATIGGAAAISNGRVYFGSGFSYPFGGSPGRNLIALSID